MQMSSLGPCAIACRFGAGWAFWGDALVYSAGVLGEKYPFSYNIPGIVATIALIMMNLVSRDDLANMGDVYSSDEGSEVGAPGPQRMGHLRKGPCICLLTLHDKSQGRPGVRAEPSKDLAVHQLLHCVWSSRWEVSNATQSCCSHMMQNTPITVSD